MKLIGYVSLGFPTIEKTKEVIEVYVKNGVDVLEIDLPAKNPFLDSEFIQNRMKGALANNDNYDDYIKAILDIRKKYPKQEIFILSYEDTIKEIGVDKFINLVLEADIKDIIYVGGNDSLIKEKLIKNNIGLASYVRLKLDKNDLLESESSNGFIYLQAKSNEMNPDYPTLENVIGYLRENEALNKKIYCGVGVSTAEDVKYVKDSGADGVFIGSTFLKLHDNFEELALKIKEFKKQTI